MSPSPVLTGTNISVDLLPLCVVERRHELGLTTVAFAERANISRSTLHGIERGEGNPSARVLGQLDRALDWTPGTSRRLMRGDDSTLRLTPPQLHDDVHPSPRRRLLALAGALPEADVVELLAYLDQRHAGFNVELERVRNELRDLRQTIALSDRAGTRKERRTHVATGS